MPDPSPEMIESRKRHEAREKAFEQWWELITSSGALPSHKKNLAREAYYAAWGGEAQSEIARVRQEAMEEAAKIADEQAPGLIWDEQDIVDYSDTG